MSDLLSESPASNAAEFTVSEISVALKRTVEDAFGNVRVRGEISGYRGPHSSGHAYFSLKDDRSRIEAVIWKGTFSRLKFRPEEGMEVVASGKLTTYPGSSKYQIVIDNLEPAGAGALMALLEERRRRLGAEGLFDERRKRPLPYLPMVIGVVTSPTGAVIRDIIHRISDRFPLHVVVWPVRVQGETTGAEVSNAVAGFNGLDPLGPIPRPDIIIVARGGGSLEDLWGFNDEAVVRAVAASAIPVISAVGHETDWTLIDHAADIRAPTPTGAAEIAVPVKAELEATLASLSARLRACISRSGDRKRETLRALTRALPSVDQLLAMPRRRFDEAAGRIARALSITVERKATRLAKARLVPATLSHRLSQARQSLHREGGQLPKAAATLIRDRRRELRGFSGRLRLDQVGAHLGRSRTALDGLGRRAANALAARAERPKLSFAALSRRGDTAMEALLHRQRIRWEQAARLASSLSYTSVLERGFAVVLDGEGGLVKRAAALSPGQPVTLRFADGERGAVTGGETPRPRPAKSRPAASQGTLFD